MSEAAMVLPVPLAETLRFVLEVLPFPPARLLEVGAGDGALAERLAELGFAITALDRSPEAAAAARKRGIDVVEQDFLHYRAAPFDVVLFTRSLHHLHPLVAAVDRAYGLIGENGILVVEDFAFDRADRPSVEWLARHESRMRAAGLLAADDDPLLPGDPLESWVAHHRITHSVHRGDEMLEALGSQFDLERVEPAPYLYRYVCSRLVDDAERGATTAQRMLDEETRLIEAGTLRAVGLRITAQPRSTSP